MTERSTLRGRGTGAEPRGMAFTAARSSHPLLEGRSRRFAAILAAIILAAALLGAAACGGGSSSSNAGASSSIDVFAAASLTDAFTQLGADFTSAHPGVKVALDFAGSNDLVNQIRQGAPADVFASADTTNMDKAGDLVNMPRVFAGNTLAIAVAPGNPEHIRGLADLSRSDLKVVLAAPEVPAGKYASEVLDKAGVSVTPASLEVAVKGVVTKIALGEADAGIVYVTDVTAAKGKIDSVPIPANQNVIASYPIATLVSSDSKAEAQAFVDLVLSDQGQRVLAGFRFLPPPSEGQ